MIKSQNIKIIIGSSILVHGKIGKLKIMSLRVERLLKRERKLRVYQHIIEYWFYNLDNILTTNNSSGRSRDNFWFLVYTFSKIESLTIKNINAVSWGECQKSILFECYSQSLDQDSRNVMLINIFLFRNY